MNNNKVRAARKIAWEIVEKGSPLTFSKVEDILWLLSEADDVEEMTSASIFENLENTKTWMLDVLNTMISGVNSSKLSGAIDHLEIVINYFKEVK